MIEHALKAQARGFHIFPVTAGLKVPHPAAGYRDAAGNFHGWGETATNDINRILYFWTRVDPQANIGVACKPSRLLVVDLDTAKKEWALRGTEWEYIHRAYGPMVDGEALFDEMMYKLADEKPHTAALDTYQVKTGSGGVHLYYWWPEAWPRISQASPVKGVVDVRGNGGEYGGYVLAEGSRTQAGPYGDRGTGFMVALAPEWLRALVAEKPKQPSARRPAGIRQPSPVSWSGLVDSVRRAGEGNRNNALHWAARTMCEEGAGVEECMSTLAPAAEQAGLPYHEVERTVQSAYRIQRREMYG